MKKIIVWLAVSWNSLLIGSENSDQLFSENLMIFVALFLLGFIGIIILFISSRQLAKTKYLHEDMVRRQMEMEKGQTSLLTNMSENIFKITKEAIDNRNSILENSKERSLENMLEKVIRAENTLLDRTNDLIGFLRLKSKKVEVINEPFNFNNVLNEVAGLVCAHFQGSQAELIFDIDNTIPRFLVGDSLHLGQIVTNLLDFALSQAPRGEVRLKVSIFYTFEEKTQLQFQIVDTGAGLNSRDLEKLFVPYYDEEAKEYAGLGRFVAYQLVSLMGGEITVQSIPDKGTTFTFVLPLQIADPNNKRHYRLPEKMLTTKKVFIVDGNYSSALAIKKMFAYFKHDVKVSSKEQFMSTRPDLTVYDIIVLDDELISLKVVDYLKKIKENKELKIIGIDSLLRPVENKMVGSVVDGWLRKPLNQERIFELIVDLYRLDKEQILLQEREKNNRLDQKLRAEQRHTMHISETPNITREQFADFRGANLLIVEDNLINQKVLTTILDKSGMNITLTNNGEEALMMVTSGKILFDLVLMDINMPVMDGYTATEYIRATGKFDDLPIVSFTALVLDSEVQKMFNSGINAFLAKPLNIGKLYTAFDMFIGSVSQQTNSKEAFSGKIEVKIDGININEGIKHANGNEALYMEVLREFLAAYEESGGLLEKLVEENRFEQVKMLCLDMKGLTGTIGAHDMYQMVDKIYKLFIYSNQQLLSEYVEAYHRELKKLSQAIHHYLEAK